jgi:transcriptional regulator with XRE-family HTH domain
MTLGLATDREVLALLGSRLAALREGQGLTGEDAAAAAGLSRRTVYRAERGQNPTLLTLVRLLRLYGRIDALAQILPEPEVSPMALIRPRPGRTDRRRRTRGRGRE